VSFVVQIDEVCRAGRVITVVPGLWIFVAPKSMAPFRREAEVTELEASCGKCGQKLHTWPFVPRLRMIPRLSTSPVIVS